MLAGYEREMGRVPGTTTPAWPAAQSARGLHQLLPRELSQIAVLLAEIVGDSFDRRGAAAAWTECVTWVCDRAG
ncbi:hypothetical protein GCM10020220_091450 [Nonomuraea rubra]